MFPDYCHVSLRSYGCYDEWEAYGYIEVDEERFLFSKLGSSSTNLRGINTMILDTENCSANEWKQFDTHGRTAAADRLVEYLRSLADGTIVLGVTFDDPTHFLKPAALSALRNFGVAPNNLKYRGKFTFFIRIGWTENVLAFDEKDPRDGVSRIDHQFPGVWHDLILSIVL